VHPHEAVPQQADDLVAVLGALVQELEQVEPEPAVAEDGAHEFPSGSEAGASAGRRSRETAPDTVVTLMEAGSMPLPILPFIRLRPGRSCRSRPNWESRVPVAERSSAVAEVSEGRRRATSPEMLASRTRAESARSTSARSWAEAVLAENAASLPPARASCPLTLLKDRPPRRLRAERLPETVLTSSSPPRSSAVTSPEAVRSWTFPVSPAATTGAETEVTSTGQSFGTRTPMVAERRPTSR